ncbi:MAG: hypothetical protein ACYDDA_05170 [Acidiferrobacteraceae bacterium]
MLASLACQPRSRFEVATYGFDPDLCGIGSDPNGSLTQAGLRVPKAPSGPAGGGAGVIGARYLFQCCTVRLPPNRPLWLVGMAELLTMYEDTADGTPPIQPVEKLIGRSGSGDPRYHFVDATVSFHLRHVRSVPYPLWANQNVLTSQSFVWRWSDSPALVFETATFAAGDLNYNGTPDNYLTLTGYTPPWNGQPPGVDVGGFGTFNSIEHPWDNPAAQAIEPIEMSGPGALVLYASVWQTNPGARGAVTWPAMMPADPQLPEVAFASAFTSAIYGRVGGKLILERKSGAVQVPRGMP